MRSMTGFGQGAAEGERFRVAVTLRAVNHRYLDVVMRLKEELRPQEKTLRNLLAGELHRGRVEAAFEVESLAGETTSLKVDRGLLASLRQTVDELAEEGLIERRIELADILRMPEMVHLASESNEEWQEEDLEPLTQATEIALEQLVASRSAEGESLRSAIFERIDALESLHGEMTERAQELPAVLAASLKERIANLVEDDAMPDETRLAQEVAITVDRNDVSEELDRLVSHLEHFRSISENDGSIGKRLDFLSQEIFRELNTIGSKCRDAALVRLVLDGKVLCEQIREQVQNVE